MSKARSILYVYKNKNTTQFPFADMTILPYQVTPEEAYMNENQKSHFRSLLLAWKESGQQKLLGEGTPSYQLQEQPDLLPDMSDRASQEEAFSLELRSRNRDFKLMRKIDEALQKLTSNQYGYCESCGGEIGIRRLEARPTATLCIDCKTLEEIREKQQGGH